MKLKLAILFTIPIKRINIVCCGYINGIMAYSHAVASKTYGYWFPTKNLEEPKDAHRRICAHKAYSDSSDYASTHEMTRERLSSEFEISAHLS